MTTFAKRKLTDLIVVHCSATKPDQDIGAREINGWHINRGFYAIGYHFVIRRDGTVETGRDVDVAGAHAAGDNWHSVGICMVGGSDADDYRKAENNFTADQWAALRSLLGDLKAKYPGATILGHRDLDGVKKACPSFDVRAWLKTVTL